MEISSSPELSLDAPWAITEDGFAVIDRWLTSIDAETIVECGSGISTVRLAIENPARRIFSIEGDKKYSDQTRNLLERNGVLSQVKIMTTAIGWRIIGLKLFKTYREIFANKNIDAVIVDGPPGGYFRGREGALRLAIPQLRDGALIFIDDYSRPGEKEAIENILRIYPLITIEKIYREGHGIAVLRQQGKKIRYSALLSDLLKNWLAFLIFLRNRVINAISKA